MLVEVGRLKEWILWLGTYLNSQKTHCFNESPDKDF